MKKLLLFLIILATIGGGFYHYVTYHQRDRNINVWSLPPTGAIWVYEANQTVTSWNRLISQPYWENLSALPFFGSMKSQFEKLDSLAGKGGNIDKILKNNPFLISCHLTSRDEFGYVFYFKIPDVSQLSLIRDILNHYEKKESLQYDSRTFAGYKINELIKKGTGDVFSYLIVNDHFVGSFNSFLIEDVIRNIDTKSKNSFFLKHASDFASINKINNDDGNIYFDASQVAQFLNVFVGKDNQELQKLSHFTRSIYFDVETEKDFILFNGSSFVPEDSGLFFLSSFKNQKAAPLNLASLVPARASVLYKYSFSNPISWQRELNAFWHINDLKYYRAREKFEKEYEISAPLFNSWIAGIGYAIIESVTPEHPDKLIYLAANDLNDGLLRFNRLAELSAERKGDTLYAETFGTSEISMVDIPNLPEMVFGPHFIGFEQCYFTTHGNYIILSNRATVLKSMLSDIEADNVWGKSLKHSRFLENTLPESNITMIINMERAWNMIMRRINNDWKIVFQKYADQLKKFEFLAFQVNQVDNRFYSGIIAQVNHEVTPDVINRQFIFNQQLETDAPIITKPFIVRNHNDKSLEVVLQDSLNQIYLISNSGEILWKLKMQNPIVGDLHQIDYFRNGKLQYLYADESSIKVIDRNGNFVSGFPMHFPDSVKIRTFSIIDYDNNSRYRMLISNDKGQLYMFNMEKENLDGWSPLTLDGNVAFPPEHIRVRGRDCIVAVEQKGAVHVLNRRGEHYPGFPLHLNTEMISYMFFENGGSFSDSKFSVVNQNGVILQFNLNGKTVNSTQLYKPSKETMFSICTDALKQTFVVARQDYNRLSLLDQNGDQLFEKDYVTSGNLSVQYYHFSMDNKIFAVTDKIQEFTYIYDASGQLINYQPIESGYEIGLLYSEANKRYQIYSCYDNRFTISSFYR